MGRLRVRDTCIGTRASQLEIPSELSLLLAAHLYLETLLLKSIANKALLFFGFVFCGFVLFCFCTVGLEQ